MKIDIVRVGYLSENCYIVSNNDKCLVIDPGDDSNRIIESIGNKKVLGILITHHHFDHVGAVDDIKNKYNVSVYDINNLKEGINKIDEFTFKVIYNPGHTDDSISFYFEEENVMFVGDFVFRDSIGRCDLGGSIPLMKQSINKLKEYDKDIVLYPGHGESTKLNYEKENNPYF